MSVVKSGRELEFFECACHGDEHTIKFRYDVEDNSLYLNIFLNQYRNIFKRIWTAIKYVFGYKSKYGDWDCWELLPEDVGRLKEVLNRVVEMKYAKCYAYFDGEMVYARDFDSWMKVLKEKNEARSRRIEKKE